MGDNMKFLIIFFLISFSLWGVVPDLIPVQGVLTDIDDTPISGNIDLTLKLYNSKTASEELWKEERNDFAVKDGYISIYLGEITKLNSSIILNSEELWLEISFNNEKMPRIRIASVPFAIEAVNAQKAKQIGDITESQIINIFNSGCADGFYIKGYDAEGNSICAEDKTQNLNDNLNYNAGNGIIIDDNNIISVSSDLYSVGDGIINKNNMISVDNTKVANILHSHNERYYEKINNAQNNNLIKFIGNPLAGYKFENSDILEESGIIKIQKLDILNGITTNTSNAIKINNNLNVNDIITRLNNYITIDADSLNVSSIITEKNLTSEGNIISQDKITSTGIETMDEAIVSKLIFSQDNQKTISKFRVIITDEAIATATSSDSSKTEDSFYILDDGSLGNNSSSDNLLTKNNSICFLSGDDMEILNTGAINNPSNTSTNKSECKVYFDGDNYWRILIEVHNGVTTKCKASCLKWN